MIIGTVKEIKNREYRVGLTPGAVYEYVKNGHEVLVETNAGVGSGFTDEDYINAGARIISTRDLVWEASNMIVKVKEPLAEEYKYLRKDLILYTYLHLAANKELTLALTKSGCTGVAYETIETADHLLPCLKPMSEVAGRLSAIYGSLLLTKERGGNGLLISGVPGTDRAKVTIIGAGVVGENALKLFVGLEADVTILDIDLNRLASIDKVYQNKVKTLYSTDENIKNSLRNADLVVGAVLIPGATAPKLIKRSYYSFMKKGSVIVDVAIDQGGSTEVSYATTHDNPTFVVDGIIHYCVANMPGIVPNTSSVALNNSTLKYGLLLANNSLEVAFSKSSALKKGLNTYNHKVYHEGVSSAFQLELSEF
ncbi:MAG: alanine dehydrogenase [Acholeplasmatales bacterium]|jgi:alanine dehydrogenase|nr:alanine dehydrogenase [Acholeplasmatales bacterium]